MCASKTDKLGGDLRVCFSIIKNTVQAKIDYLNSIEVDLEILEKVRITLHDVNEVCEEMFASKLV